MNDEILFINKPTIYKLIITKTEARAAFLIVKRQPKTPLHFAASATTASELGVVSSTVPYAF